MFVFQDQLNCLLVCKLWNEFTSGHVFKRRVERMVDEDESLQVSRFSVTFRKLLQALKIFRKYQSASNGIRAFMFLLTLSLIGQFTRKCWRKYFFSKTCGGIENQRWAQRCCYVCQILYLEKTFYILDQKVILRQFCTQCKGG